VQSFRLESQRLILTTLSQVPIYITAAIVAVGAAWYSDRRKQRSPFILFFMSLIAIGFIIVIASTGRGVPGVVYFGVFIAVIGKSSLKSPLLSNLQR
jgi:uncharacterized membrane protein SirB2